MGELNADLLCEMLVARGELFGGLSGVKPEAAWRRPEPDEWSVVEILQHIADHDQLTLKRLSGVLAGEMEMVPRVQAEWDEPRAAAERDGLPGVVRRLYGSFSPLLEAVSDLTGDDLKRSGIHPRRGMMTVRELMLKLAEHDRNHAGQIAETRAVVEA